jgi:hypothetical protein
MSFGLVPGELHVHPGEIRGYNVLLWRPAVRAMWQGAHRFLARHLGKAAPAGGAPPTIST